MDNHDPDPDIVELILQACIEVGLDAVAAQAIDKRMREKHGGQRVRIPKRKKHPSQEERQRIYQDAISNTPEKEITDKYKISRASLYRIIKSG